MAAATSSESKARRDGRGNLTALMFAAFVDMMGLLMVVPQLPFVATRLGAGGFVVGALVSSFSLAQLLSAPLWGRMSDRYGRRPVLLTALTASVAAYLIFAWASVPAAGANASFYLLLLFLSRIVQGAGGGTVGVIQAYVADSTAPDERAKALGWLSAATNAGVAIGPVLGSLSHHLGSSGPGLFAAGLCVVNIAFAWKYLRESRDMKEAAESKADRGQRARSRDAIVHVISHSAAPASRLIWIYAIAIGAFQGVTSMLALLLSARFGVTEQTIGFFFAYIGALSVFTRALILGRMVDKYGEARLARIGQILLATGIALLSIIRPLADPAAVAAMLGGILPWRAVALLPYLPLAVAVAFLPLGTAFTFPCVTSLLSRVISSKERGLYMGVQQTFGGLARVIFPILFGYLYDKSSGLPFLVSASFVLFTLYLGVGMDSYARTDAKAAAA